MTAKIAKWGNSPAIRIPKEIMNSLSLHVGDAIIIEEKDNTVVIHSANSQKDLLQQEAKRIKEHSLKEYQELEESIDDGL